MNILKWLGLPILAIFSVAGLAACGSTAESTAVVGQAPGSDAQGLATPTIIDTSQVNQPPLTSPTQGVWIIGMDQNNQIIQMVLGERFELRLQDGYIWDVIIEDQAVVGKVVTAEKTDSGQGFYEALLVGETELNASGDPRCRFETPACMQPSLLFNLSIKVIQP